MDSSTNTTNFKGWYNFIYKLKLFEKKDNKFPEVRKQFHETTSYHVPFLQI